MWWNMFRDHLVFYKLPSQCWVVQQDLNEDKDIKYDQEVTEVLSKEDYESTVIHFYWQGSWR